MAILGGYRVSGLCANGLPAGPLQLAGALPVIPLDFTLPVAGAEDGDFAGAPQACQEQNDQIQLVVYVTDAAGNPVNLLAATTLQIKLLAPDGTAIDRAAALLTSGVDGALQYTTTAADLLEDGLYRVQAKYIIGGKTQTTRWGQFRVGENIDDA